MMHALVVCLLIPAVSSQLLGLPTLPGLPDPFNLAGTTTTEAPSTTEDPCPTTNGYQAQGWETDDDGNVWWGNDQAKFFLIQQPAAVYWKPLPRDWPEGPLFGSQYPDSQYYRGTPPPRICPCGKCPNQPAKTV